MNSQVFALKNLAQVDQDYWTKHDLFVDKTSGVLKVAEKAGGIGEGLMVSSDKEKVAKEVLSRMTKYLNQLEAGTIKKDNATTVDMHVGKIIKKLTSSAPSNPLMIEYNELHSRIQKLR